MQYIKGITPTVYSIFGSRVIWLFREMRELAYKKLLIKTLKVYALCRLAKLNKRVKIIIKRGDYDD